LHNKKCLQLKTQTVVLAGFEVNEIYHCEKIKKMPKKYMKK
jgi:hypothetical protein